MSDSLNDFFSNDPILSKMNDHNIAWADLLLTSDNKVNVKDKDMPDMPNSTILRRKMIQRTWPVLVRVQPSTKLGIQWNVRKLAEWRASNPNPLDWKLYEVQNAKAMIAALQDANWIVSAPTHSAFLCSIERPERGCSSTITDALTQWQYEEPDCPTMLCLNDIKDFFPVIWHKLDNAKNCKVYSIELYHYKIRTMACKRSVIPEILTVHLSHLLDKTLAQSPAWEVKNANAPGEFCQLAI